jgi:hypothetical protein
MKKQPKQYTVPSNIVKPPSSQPTTRQNSSFVQNVPFPFADSVDLPGMVQEQNVKSKAGTSSYHGTYDRVVQKFLEADDEGRRRMEVMYGIKVLNKLIAAWEAQTADREYLRENTVRPLFEFAILACIFVGCKLMVDGVSDLSCICAEKSRMQ